MSVKSPLIAIATFLTIISGSMVSADTYRTSKNQVVVTGLKAKQKYDLDVINIKGKNRKRQLTTNTCGQLLIDNAVKYKSLSVAGQTIDPATLNTKTHQRCKPKKNQTATPPKSSTTKVNPTVTITPIPVPKPTP
jgi:hypothetical protein